MFRLFAAPALVIALSFAAACEKSQSAPSICLDELKSEARLDCLFDKAEAELRSEEARNYFATRPDSLDDFWWSFVVASYVAEDLERLDLGANQMRDPVGRWTAHGYYSEVALRSGKREAAARKLEILLQETGLADFYYSASSLPSNAAIDVKYPGVLAHVVAPLLAGLGKSDNLVAMMEVLSPRGAGSLAAEAISAMALRDDGENAVALFDRVDRRGLLKERTGGFVSGWLPTAEYFLENGYVKRAMRVCAFLEYGERPRMVLAVARRLQESGEIDKAEAFIAQSFTKEEDDETRLLLAVVAAHDRRHDEALKLQPEVHGHATYAGSPNYEFIRALVETDAEVEYLDLVPETGTANDRASHLIFVARVLLRLSRPDLALPVLEEVRGILQTQGIIRADLIGALLQAGQREQALEMYDSLRSIYLDSASKNRKSKSVYYEASRHIMRNMIEAGQLSQLMEMVDESENLPHSAIILLLAEGYFREAELLADKLPLALHRSDWTLRVAKAISPNPQVEELH